MTGCKFLAESCSATGFHHIYHITLCRKHGERVQEFKSLGSRYATAIIIDYEGIFLGRVKVRRQIVEPLNTVPARAKEVPVYATSDSHVAINAVKRNFAYGFTLDIRAGSKFGLIAIAGAFTAISKENCRRFGLLCRDAYTLDSAYRQAIAHTLKCFRINTPKGMILPFCQLNSNSYDKKHSGATFSLPYGLTYITSNPWASNELAITAGYGWQTDSYGIGMSYTAACDTGLYTYSISGQGEFDSDGFKSTEGQIQLQLAKSFASRSAFVFSPAVLAHYGRSNALPEEYMPGNSPLSLEMPKLEKGFGKTSDMNNYFYFQATAPVYYHNIVKTRAARYGKSGFLLGFTPLYIYSSNVTENIEEFSNFDISVFMEVYIPHLLPVDCSLGYTYNLPTKFVFQAFNTNVMGTSFVSIPLMPELAYIYGETVLVAGEVQKSLPVFSFFYLNDYSLSLAGFYGYGYNEKRDYTNTFADFGTYISDIQNGDILPRAELQLKLSLGFNPLNFGMLNGNMNLSASYGIELKNEKINPAGHLYIDVAF